MAEETEHKGPLAIVIANGSSSIKVGFAGAKAPHIFEPPIVGRPTRGVREGEPQFYIGSDVLKKRAVLTVKYPIERGIVVSWNDVEHIWRHIFEERLKVEPEDHPVFLTEPPLNPKDNVEMATQTLFEEFEVPAMYVASEAVMALYAVGKKTGTVVDCGEGVSSCVPVCNGVPLPQGIKLLELSGGDITDYLMKMLVEKGHSFSSMGERAIVSNLKEKLCYVAEDYDEELEKSKSEYSEDYTLPDGQVISVAKERFKACEAFFKPSFIGGKGEGVASDIYESISLAEEDMQSELLSNVLVVGGGSKLKNFPHRLQTEIQALTSGEVNVEAPEDREILGWKGASMLAATPSFSKEWVSKQEYDEGGPSVVFRKCCK